MQKGDVFYSFYTLSILVYTIISVTYFWNNKAVAYATIGFGLIAAVMVLITAIWPANLSVDQKTQLRELIKERRSLPIALVASQMGMSVAKAAGVLRRTGFLALSSDASTVLSITRLTEDLLSHADTMGKIDVHAVCAEWSLDERFLVSLVPKMSKDVIANNAGNLYSRSALEKIVETELATKGRFDAREEAIKRGLTLQGSDVVFSLAKLKIPVLVTIAGAYLRKDMVIRNLKSTLDERGVLDLGVESRKLGVYDAALYLADALTDTSHIRIPGTSLIADKSWITDLQRRAREMGVVNLKEFADSLGISSASLGLVLSTYLQGFVDESTGIFYVRGAPVYTPAAGRPKEAYAARAVTTDVQVLRGGEFVGNRLRYKVKVLNNTRFVITDVTVSLVTYPRDAMSVEGPIVKTIAKIDPSGFDSPLFEFLPTKDCVKGDIIAMTSYVDHEGKPHTAMTEPFTVRAVCDLLIPENITPEQFELRLADLSHGEMTFKVEDWTPEEMHSKALQVLEKSNFSEVTSNQSTIGEHIQSRITGWARGKYTRKNLGVEVTITGRPGVKGATCSVRMSGEDEAMIMPAIDEMSQNLTAWLCPMCGGDMPEHAVSLIREGKHSKCPFCGVTVGR
ncbi:MAG: hypothetical protein C4K47_08745 [Candidatus Thorarchaeota archaeon]|nr:MAG: hypothetical protein C4K47_08745 [Candidatus Thorarchaeota archaeon]